MRGSDRTLQVDEVTPDGSPVEVYRRLPPMGEPEIVHAAIPGGATILELGSGAGRMTMPLVALGHAVTAVDDSPAMLASIRGAETILAKITRLRLDRRFGAVLAASHLLNTDEPFRGGLLDTVHRHLEPNGVAIFEVYPSAVDWPAAVGVPRTLGAVTITLLRATKSGDHVDASVAFEMDGRRWEQPFVAVMLDEVAIRTVLADAGLRFERWVDVARGWFIASSSAPDAPTGHHPGDG